MMKDLFPQYYGFLVYLLGVDLMQNLMLRK